MTKHKCSWCGDIFEPKPSQKARKTLGQPTYCHDKNCYREAHNDRMRAYQKQHRAPKKWKNCKLCGKRFFPYHHSQKYCSSYNHRGCAYKALLKLNNDISKKNAHKRMFPKQKSNRKCKTCGKDPWPNYFFCKGCHSVVSNSVEDNEHYCAVI